MQFLQHSARVRFLILSFAFLTMSTFLRAQLVGGTITGEVVDPNNAAVVGAGVQIRNQETGGVRALVTAQGGAFSAPSIAVGVYTISVTQDGFAPLKRTGIALTAGQS